MLSKINVTFSLLLYASRMLLLAAPLGEEALM